MMDGNPAAAATTAVRAPARSSAGRHACGPEPCRCQLGPRRWCCRWSSTDTTFSTYARPDTVGAYTDLPVFMWYEVEPTTRGVRYRYSVPFQGRRESRHPLPWVSTDNNMVRFEGTTRELADKALAFTVRVGTVWISSDRGVTGQRGAALLRPGGHAFELPVP